MRELGVETFCQIIAFIIPGSYVGQYRICIMPLRHVLGHLGILSEDLLVIHISFDEALLVYIRGESAIRTRSVPYAVY